MMQDRDNLFNRVKQSFFRGPVYPGTEKERKWAAFENLILHVHPRNVPEQTLKFTLTWGLGGMSLVLVLLLAMTGILLLFVYQPFPDKAYESILTLQNEVAFGQFIRNVHHWSGNILVMIGFLHLLRVFFTGAFRGPRQFNWIIGLALLFCVLLSNFTGYLLPWDQLAYWAIIICTSMLEYIPLIGTGLQNIIRGGPEVGSSTLMIFFTLHTTVIPVLFVLLLPFHFWRIRKAGGIVIPPSGEETAERAPRSVPTIPNLLLREAVSGLVLIAFVFMYASLFNAPLMVEANPGMSPNPAKAPWYFLGLQELLLHFHPLFSVLIIPGIVVVLFIALPYLRYDSSVSGVWFHSQKARRMGIVAAVTGFIVTVAGIVIDEFLVDFSALLPGVPPAVSSGLIPVVICSAGIVLFQRVMKKKYSASNNETVQALFILLLASLLVLTATGIWFRGEGMALVWPWQ